jgi:hypothetical protein
LAADPSQRARIRPENPASKAAEAQKRQENNKGVKTPAKPADNKVAGKPAINRPPSLLQKQNRSGPYARPFVGGGGAGGNFNGRNGGGRFGGPGGGPGGPGGNFQAPFGGNNRNFNRGGNGGGNFGGGGGGNQPNVMDALQLLNQLRNNGGGGGDNDDSFYNRRAPKQDNFNNDFGGNFGGNRGGSFNNGPRNNFGGGGGNSGNGGGWFKVSPATFSLPFNSFLNFSFLSFNPGRQSKSQFRQQQLEQQKFLRKINDNSHLIFY